MAFNVSEWLKSALIDGVKNGTMAREFVVTKTVDYMAKGILSEPQVQEIATAIEPAPVEEQVEEMPEVTSEYVDIAK